MEYCNPSWRRVPSTEDEAECVEFIGWGGDSPLFVVSKELRESPDWDTLAFPETVQAIARLPNGDYVYERVCMARQGAA